MKFNGIYKYIASNEMGNVLKILGKNINFFATLSFETFLNSRDIHFYNIPPPKL